jgi:8-oxo-dGTP pyrophosphatase MutT (NUDIX family)
MSPLRFEDAPSGAPLIPAATDVLLRDSDAGPECLMLKKNRGQAFGGMWVFPGGKVDAGDVEPGDDEVDSARRAAVRESAEETGLVLSDGDLVPFSHWVPPEEAPKRFSTWFFVAELPEGLADVVVDGGEIGDHVWTTADAVMARHAAGEVELAPPTWISLWWLAQHASADAALDAARSVGEIAKHFTHVHVVDGVLVTVWEPDAGYESGDLDAPGARNRLHMPDGRAWRYEREPVE